MSDKTSRQTSEIEKRAWLIFLFKRGSDLSTSSVEDKNGSKSSVGTNLFLNFIEAPKLVLIDLIMYASELSGNSFVLWTISKVPFTASITRSWASDLFPDRMKFHLQEDILIFNENRQGQIKSVDYAYSMVETPYIFHLEDDWEFYESYFIEH